MPTPDNHSRLELGRDHASALTEHILCNMRADVPISLACVYAYSHDLQQLELVASCPADALPSQADRQVRAILLPRMAAVGAEAAVVEDEQVKKMGFQSAVICPLLVGTEIAGVLAVHHEQANAYGAAALQAIGTWGMIVEAVLENQRLRADQHITEVIRIMAQFIGSSPDPQDLVETLREHLFGAHITTCAVMFYGPLREDRPNGPFDYLEVRGSWSKRAGSGTAQGIKIYLDEYPEFLAQLDERKFVATKLDESVVNKYDALIRGLLRAEEIQSMMWVALHVGGRRVGVLFVGTDKPHYFDIKEIRSYRTVSEFLAVTTMANILQQQHDFVQRARGAVLDAVTDGVMMVLPDSRAGSKEGAYILTVNQGFTRMFRVNQSQAQGLSLTQALDRMQIPQDVSQDLSRQWNSIQIRDPATQRGEFNMMHPDGFPAAIEWYSAPVYHDSRVMGRMYIFHDASAARAAANLRANFISRVSHELRTPLTSIRGFAEFMLDEIGDELPDLAREYTEIIVNSARHLNALFNDIIEITRADTGEMNLHLTRAHLPDLIIDTAAQLELQYKEQRQQVILDLDDDLPAVMVDENRITQVLTNLLTNAIKFAPPDTRIRVSTDLIASGRQVPGSAPPDVVIPAILVTVTDEGPGLSPEDAEQVFMPFFRTRDARAGQTEGTGLGLTIARSIIELHRGKLWAEGRKRGRRGARFLFTLPTAEG